VRLVEREGALAVLRRALSGPPRLVLVAGEAGAGKTSLIRALIREVDDALLGACDALSTARPLAPILDWVGSSVEELPAVLAQARLAVIEDAHWADDATIALLSRLSRRPLPATVVLTYRDDEVGPGHPLAFLLGELATQSPLRIRVAPLSVSAVAALAEGSSLDPEKLHARTNGNAFFVSECLEGGSLDVSDNVRDAVLGRAARLPVTTRDAVEAVAVVPGRCELWLAEALGATAPAIDDAVARGLLVAGPSGSVAVRHELARLVLSDELAPGRRRDLHRRAVAALTRPALGAVDHARVVHHAVLASDADAVARHAELAAREAEASGARSQAVAQLELAVAYATADADLVGLWSRLAEQRALMGADTESIAAYERAVGYARAAGDDMRTGVLLARLSVPLSMAGRLATARSTAEAAVALLETYPPSARLALAYAQACTQHMLARELAQARVWGAKALDLARVLGDAESEAYASIQSGVASWMGGDLAGLDLIHRGIVLAREYGLAGLVAQGLSQIGSGGGEIGQYDIAVPALQECIAWSEQHELGSRGRYAQAWLGRCQMELGHWDDAARCLDGLLRSPRSESITRMTALTALGRLRARRGDPGGALLDEALSLALRTGHLQRLWPVAVARAEAAWLTGDVTPELALLRSVLDLAQALDYRPAVAELEWWLTPSAGPYPAQTPYERALGLEGVDELAALAIFEELGALPSVRRVTQRRRLAGLSVPRGPNATTLNNPAGLTARELDVLRLVAVGDTNAAIAASLHISVKTVGHHVTHLLEKLAARTRTEAVTRALSLGLLQEK
jgi:DNA-binding CsgD family transcriptional regulator/tetratricopeptide (TPR) repeat protein